MLTPFMPCGAKLPVIALFVGAFFPDTPWVGTLMYFAGIVFILLGALLVKAITGFKYRKSFFIIELPEYKLPSLKRAVVSMLGRGKAYIIKAGTIILVCNTMVQIMQSFDWHLQVVEEGMESTSILATIASPIAFLLVPIVGIAAWQLACFAALGAMNAEMQSKKWLWGGIALQLGTGYTVAFLVYQFGTLLTTGRLGNGFVPGLIAVFAMGAVVVGLIYRTKKRIQAEFGQPVVRKI